MFGYFLCCFDKGYFYPDKLKSLQNNGFLSWCKNSRSFQHILNLFLYARMFFLMKRSLSQCLLELCRMFIGALVRECQFVSVEVVQSCMDHLELLLIWAWDSKMQTPSEIDIPVQHCLFLVLSFLCIRLNRKNVNIVHWCLPKLSVSKSPTHNFKINLKIFTNVLCLSVLGNGKASTYQYYFPLYIV